MRRLEPQNKIYLLGAPGNGGYFHLTENNSIIYDNIFHYDGGLNSLKIDREEISDYLSSKINKCSSCGTSIGEEYGHWINNIQYCESCLEEYFINCPHCGEYVDREQMYEVGDEDICFNCYSDLYFTCNGCLDSFSNEQRLIGPNGIYYCPRCHDRLFTVNLQEIEINGIIR